MAKKGEFKPKKNLIGEHFITLHGRVYRYGWDIGKALTTPIAPGKGWRSKKG